MAQPDFIPRKYRIADPAAIRRKVRQDPSCRSCGQGGREGHHVVFRSHGGDDVEENIVCLCHLCHSILHQSANDEDRHRVRSSVGKKLTPDEMGYALDRLGDVGGREFLRRHYNVPANDPRYSQPRKRSRPRGIGNLHAIGDL